MYVLIDNLYNSLYVFEGWNHRKFVWSYRIGRQYFARIHCYLNLLSSQYTTSWGRLLMVPYFGQNIPDNNRSNITRIRFLTYFGSGMSDIQLESGKKKKKIIKTHFMDYDWVRFRTSHCRFIPWSYIGDHTGTS